MPVAEHPTAPAARADRRACEARKPRLGAFSSRSRFSRLREGSDCAAHSRSRVSHVYEFGRLVLFLQTDPIPGASANAYDYCNADPVNCVDLDGMAPTDGRCESVGFCRGVWRGSGPPKRRCGTYCKTVKFVAGNAPIPGVGVVIKGRKIARAIKKGCAIVLAVCSSGGKADRIPDIPRKPTRPGQYEQEKRPRRPRGSGPPD